MLWSYIGPSLSLNILDTQGIEGRHSLLLLSTKFAVSFSIYEQECL